MRANWFIALPVVAGTWFEKLSPPPGVRLFGPGDLHITVAFLGPVAEEAAQSAFELASAFTLPPLEVQLGQVEGLGAKRSPTAYSALLSVGRQPVENAISAAREAMWQRAQARADKRPALAHMTLARPQSRSSPEQQNGGLAWARALDLGHAACQLDRIALYTWSEDRSRTLFRICRALPLMAAVSTGH
jgi:2'-5' RNA ligase